MSAIPPKRMTWREEQRRLEAWLAEKSGFPKPLDTAKRVARRRRKRKASEKVLRWQARHPRTHARRMRAWRRRRGRGGDKETRRGGDRVTGVAVSAGKISASSVPSVVSKEGGET